MAEDSGQERSEQPTPKRLRESREKGEIARSRELTTALVLLTGAGGLLLMGPSLIGGVYGIMRNGLQISRAEIFNAQAPLSALQDLILEAMSTLAPLFTLLVLVAFFGPMALGGFAFSPKAVAFKWDKLDPIKGFGKIFAVRGLVELVKALAKFAIIGLATALVLWNLTDTFVGLGDEPVKQALGHLIRLIGWSFLGISATLIIIAAVDVPFQLWDHSKKLRMTKQEVKDEHKQTDGSPEVRARVRRIQREMAERRMMAEVPKADVVVTNPTHYAVALRYNDATMGAPVVVAKGADLVAGQIRKVANAHQVPIVSAPALARALYHSTELNRVIPSGLYLAVAQVLAYIYQLKQRRGTAKAYAAQTPLSMPDLPIPDDLKRD